jgi:cellulose synthase/poly-beta-1,6-N-acetylglucosamine synthase-like glycosyltransferase
LFSIVVPVLNEEANIPTLARSVSMQTYRPIELLIVDDGSTDRSVQLVRHFATKFGERDFGIILIEEEQCGHRARGPAFARNLGIDRARGSYVLLVDADVMLSDPTILEELHVAFGENRVAGFRTKVPVDTWLEYNLMLDVGAPPFSSKSWSCLAFERNLLVSFKFDPSLGVGEDKDLMDRLSRAGLLKPSIIQAAGSIHLAHTLREFRLQKRWQGRSFFPWLMKHHSLGDLLNLAPAVPFALLAVQVIAYPIFGVLAVPLTAAFLTIPLTSFWISPARSMRRMIYLMCVRYVYGSFFFIAGLVQSAIEFTRTRSINPSRIT